MRTYSTLEGICEALDYHPGDILEFQKRRHAAMKYIRLSLFFALMLCLLLSVSPAAFANQEGTCGPDATWRFEDGTLTISGTGPVTEICWYEFHNSIVKVVVEPGIINLPENAFHDCKFLTDLSLPEGLIQLGSFAFSNCHSLGTVLLPSTLKSIGDHAFGNSGLTGITIPGSVEKIGVSAFDNCYKLMRVTLEEGITSIGTSAFSECKKLRDITLPESLDTLGENAFQNCTALSNIVLPQNLKVIPPRAFQGCESLESVTLSPKTTRIEYEAFQDCHALRSITIPPSVQFLRGLPSTLQEIHISNLAAWCTADHSSENHCLEHAGLYLNGELITDLVIPEGCSTISKYAFQGYGKLKSVTFPEGVTSIDSSAFQDCYSLTYVALPRTLQYIGDFAFGYAVNINTVVYNGSVDDLQNVEIYGGNDALLDANWQANTPGVTTLAVNYYGIALVVACLVQLGVLIACLVIYIRQKSYPFL